MYAGNPYPRFLSPPPLATGLALVACLPLLHSFERQMNVCRQLLPKGFKPPPPATELALIACLPLLLTVCAWLVLNSLRPLWHVDRRPPAPPAEFTALPRPPTRRRHWAT